MENVSFFSIKQHSAEKIQNNTPYSFKELPEIKLIFQSELENNQKDMILQ